MPNLPANAHPATINRLLSQSLGSPFSPGIPLESHQPIFGREEAFRFLAGEITRFKSVNLIGERRMGKTSFLNHLLGNQDKHLRSDLQPPLVLVRVDLQENISKAEQFYGKVLRELMDKLFAKSFFPGADSWRKRLQENPEASAIEFENVLKSLKDVERDRARPVLLIDEFERVFEPHLKAGFPFPDFFDGLRAQITANRVAMVIFTREKLIRYFTQQSLTSTFPTYFHPLTLGELEKNSADELLLQSSDFPLTTEQARQARAWAGFHPCRLQCAGASLYLANSEGKPLKWAKTRYQEIVKQLGFTNPKHMPLISAGGLIHRLKQPHFWLPLSAVICLGILSWFNKIQLLAVVLLWCKANALAATFIFMMLLILFGKVNGTQAFKFALNKFLGEEREEKKEP